jgi:hypothetical protein
VGGVSLFGGGVAAINEEKTSVEHVVDTYMRSMEAIDAEAAYALFSGRARGRSSRRD